MLRDNKLVFCSPLFAIEMTYLVQTLFLSVCILSILIYVHG
uniref:Uncharacterized protein n=1 Tax=Arundo donax TaxID=35708 RepID=A0A0A9HVS7_ARUDO